MSGEFHVLAALVLVKDPHWPLNTILDVPQSQSGDFRVEKYLFPAEGQTVILQLSRL